MSQLTLACNAHAEIHITKGLTLEQFTNEMNSYVRQMLITFIANYAPQNSTSTESSIPNSNYEYELLDSIGSNSNLLTLFGAELPEGYEPTSFEDWYQNQIVSNFARSIRYDQSHGYKYSPCGLNTAPTNWISLDEKNNVIITDEFVKYVMDYIYHLIKTDTLNIDERKNGNGNANYFVTQILGLSIAEAENATPELIKSKLNDLFKNIGNGEKDENGNYTVSLTNYYNYISDLGYYSAEEVNSYFKDDGRIYSKNELADRYINYLNWEYRNALAYNDVPIYSDGVSITNIVSSDWQYEGEGYDISAEDFANILMENAELCKNNEYSDFNDFYSKYETRRALNMVYKAAGIKEGDSKEIIKEKLIKFSQQFVNKETGEINCELMDLWLISSGYADPELYKSERAKEAQETDNYILTTIVINETGEFDSVALEKWFKRQAIPDLKDRFGNNFKAYEEHLKQIYNAQYAQPSTITATSVETTTSTGIPVSTTNDEDIPTQAPISSETKDSVINTSMSRISEEDAIKQGYTVIKTTNDLIQAISKGTGNLILMSNIDLTNIETPLDSYEKPFAGTIDCNGFIVSVSSDFASLLWGEITLDENWNSLATVKNPNFRAEYKHQDQSALMEQSARQIGLTNFNGIEGVYYSENEYGIYLHIWDPTKGEFTGGSPYRVKDEATNLNIHYNSFEDFCQNNGDAATNEAISLLLAYRQGFDIVQNRSGEVVTTVFVKDGKNYIYREKSGDFTEVINSSYINHPEGYDIDHNTSRNQAWNDYKTGYFWSFSSPTVSTDVEAKLDDSTLADKIQEAVIKKAQELGMTNIYPTNNEYVFVVSANEGSLDYVLYYDIATGTFTEVPLENDPNAAYLNKNATPALKVNPNEYQAPKLPEGYEVAAEKLLKEHPELKETASPYVFMFTQTYVNESGEEVIESVVYCWNPKESDFEKFTEKRVGTQYSSEGSGQYLDAYKKGFFPTSWNNIFEKDGVYYQFTEKPGQNYNPKAGYYTELTPAMFKELTGEEMPNK